MDASSQELVVVVVVVVVRVLDAGSSGNWKRGLQFPRFGVDVGEDERGIGVFRGSRHGNVSLSARRSGTVDGDSRVTEAF